MADFGWDYPPGVTGNEPELTGETEPDCNVEFDDEPREGWYPVWTIEK